MNTSLILNTPYDEPAQHWKYDRERREFSVTNSRRPSGYLVASAQQDDKLFDDPGVFVPIELVKQIREKVKEWKEAGCPGITSMTKRLLEHWRPRDEEGQRRFFFCQIEAIETLIFLTEAPEHFRRGIKIPSDGGKFSRWCSKMATGTGKTILMAMLIAWHVLNKVANNKDNRFSKSVFIVAPNLTVRSRLQVLQPSGADNYYDDFDIVPDSLRETLRQGTVQIVNWQALQWDSQEQIDKKKSVDKRGVKSDTAYSREVLGDLKNAKNILVINDEAHHAWRLPTDEKLLKGIDKEEIKESTVWVGALDRIHTTNKILRCFDLSATPFRPTGKRASEETLYEWIVSDFGLNDAIEAGLVKTPRAPSKDDSAVTDDNLRSRLYHLYRVPEVQTDISRSNVPVTEPLPDLVKNAYMLLAKDWSDEKKRWQETNQPTPPVMITIANNTATSSRIKYAFDTDAFMLNDICNIGDADKICRLIVKR
ncbi:MAG: DEAD/DEAH box helicase family protein [Planctomycetaceae bacterium]|jgi:type III restriction enzyme|nr:DEAD/DEAH box helicase family protein [Planctomycetaceae bacterium]